MTEKVICCVSGCKKEATIEIKNKYSTGEKDIKHYCSEHGKTEFQKLFREMYGLPQRVDLYWKKMK